MQKRSWQGNFVEENIGIDICVAIRYIKLWKVQLLAIVTEESVEIRDLSCLFT